MPRFRRRPDPSIPNAELVVYDVVHWDARGITSRGPIDYPNMQPGAMSMRVGEFLDLFAPDDDEARALVAEELLRR